MNLGDRIVYTKRYANGELRAGEYLGSFVKLYQPSGRIGISIDGTRGARDVEARNVRLATADDIERLTQRRISE